MIAVPLVAMLLVYLTIAFPIDLRSPFDVPASLRSASTSPPAGAAIQEARP